MKVLRVLGWFAIVENVCAKEEPPPPPMERRVLTEGLFC